MIAIFLCPFAIKCSTACFATSLSLMETDEKVSFPWFGKADPDTAGTYTRFVSKLCDLARTAKRVNEGSKPVENEKYAFRCFLLRLGFIGDEYKADRKLLLALCYILL